MTIFALVLQGRRGDTRVERWKEEGLNWKGGEVPAVLDDDHLDLDHLHGDHHSFPSCLHTNELQHQQLHRIKHSLKKTKMPTEKKQKGLN